MLDRDDNIEAIIELARLSHAESRFGYIPFSGGKVCKAAVKAKTYAAYKFVSCQCVIRCKNSRYTHFKYV
jgi:hypothetical protein